MLNKTYLKKLTRNNKLRQKKHRELITRRLALYSRLKIFLQSEVYAQTET